MTTVMMMMVVVVAVGLLWLRGLGLGDVKEMMMMTMMVVMVTWLRVGLLLAGKRAHEQVLAGESEEESEGDCDCDCDCDCDWLGGSEETEVENV